MHLHYFAFSITKLLTLLIFSFSRASFTISPLNPLRRFSCENADRLIQAKASTQSRNLRKSKEGSSTVKEKIVKQVKTSDEIITTAHCHCNGGTDDFVLNSKKGDPTKTNICRGEGWHVVSCPSSFYPISAHL